MNKKLAIVTCCLDDWGGSEELWARSIDLLEEQHLKQIVVFKNKINREHPEFIRLLDKHILLKELDPKDTGLKNITSKLANALRRLGNKMGVLRYHWNKPAERLYKQLKSDPPDLVLISQGINFDGLVFAYQCLKLKIRYIIVSHKAVSFYWPQPGDRTYMKKTLLHAEKCFFVSEHNRKLTEEQFGIKLLNSAIAINPVKTAVNQLTYPTTANGYHLACVGRLFVIDKGQDILLRILAQPKWKKRNFTVSFIGKGPDREGLIEMAKLLEIDHVFFPGYIENIEKIWINCHALILPSRSEGLPLTVIEAMSLGRMVIGTNAGGNSEVIQHGITGYIGEATEKDLDEAMELAWNNRDDWENMGVKAAKHICEIIPECPERNFANFIINSLNV